MDNFAAPISASGVIYPSNITFSFHTNAFNPDCNVLNLK